MPKIDHAAYANAEAKMGGGTIEQMEPGLYKLYIQAIRLGWDTKDGHTDGLAKQCVRIVWDVASGPFEKKYCEDYFVDEVGDPDPKKDFMHSTFISWKTLEYFKYNMQVLSACNDGFDALAAFEADNWDAFLGKEFYAVINGEVDLNDNGYDRWKLSVGPWLTPAQISNGEIPEPQIKDNRNKSRGGQGGGYSRSYDDYDV